MSRTNIYMQNQHVLVVDGIPLSGFAEGDFITVKADGNAAETTKGGDGPAMNFSTDQGGEIGIHLLPTSPALGTMYAIREAQKENPRLFSVILMTGVMELIRGNECAFGDLPQFATGGPTMQPRQFALKALGIKMDASAMQTGLGAVV